MKPKIFTREQIEKVLDVQSLIESIEDGMILASLGKVNLAQTSMLHLNSPPGDVHIKSAHIIGDESYVVKIASALHSGFVRDPMDITICDLTGIAAIDAQIARVVVSWLS